MADDELQGVTGLWVRQPKNPQRKRFWTGGLDKSGVRKIIAWLEQHPDGCEFMLFENERRRSDKDPALRLVVKPPWKRDDQRQAPPQRSDTPDDDGQEDIPF